MTVGFSRPATAGDGDINANGETNLGDLVLLYQFVTGSRMPTPQQSLDGDMNLDGELDVADILLLQKQLLNLPDTTPPTVPVNVSAAASGPTQVNVSWDASTDVGGGVVAGYRVYRSDVGLLATVTGTSFSDTSVVPSTSYEYTVLAFDNAAFTPIRTLTVDTDPRGLTSGDLNNDSIPDLVSANLAAGNISVLLGKTGTSGGFETALNTSVGAGVFNVAVGNLVGDANADVVVAKWDNLGGDNEVTILPGLGDGTFGTAIPFTPSPAIFDPRDVVLGDADNDGDLDLIVAEFKGNSVRVFLKDAAPADTFTEAPDSPFSTGIGPLPFGLVFADATGDGIPDITFVNVSVATSTVRVLKGSNDGNFTPLVGSPFTTGTRPYSVAVGDVDGINGPDLVVANSNDNSVSLFRNNGADGYLARVDMAAGTDLRDIALANVSGDSNLDIVAANEGSNDISVLEGDGTGGFSAAISFPAGSAPSPLVVDDFDGDGVLDLAVANTGAGSTDVSVLINSPPANESTQSSPVSAMTPANPGLPLTYNFTSTDVSAWLTPSNTGIAGTWAVSGGVYRQSTDVGDQQFGIPFDQSYKLGTYAYLGGLTTLSDYRVSVDITPQRDTAARDAFDGQDVGLMFRYQDNDNYYRVSFSARESFARLEKKVGAVFTTLATNAQGYVEGQTFNVSVNLSGDLIQVTRGTDPLFAVRDTSLPSGTVALYCQDAADFDNVVIDNSDPNPTLVVSTPLAHSVQTGAAVTASAAVTNLPAGGSVEFSLGAVACAAATESPAGSGFYTASCGSQAQGDYYLPGQGLVGRVRNSCSPLPCTGDAVATDENTRVGILGDQVVSVGDSLTLGTFDFFSRDNTSMDGRVVGQQGFQASLSDSLTATRGYPSMVFNQGVGGDRTTDTLTRITSILERYPGSNIMLLMLGANDSSTGTALTPAVFQANMQSLVNSMNGQDKVVWVAKSLPVLPYAANATRNADLAAYNTVIDSLTAAPDCTGCLQHGPNFFKFFYDDNNTPGTTTDDYERLSMFYDKLHGNALAYSIMATLWNNALTGATTVPFYLDRLCNRLVSATCTAVSPTNHKQNLLPTGYPYYVDQTYTLTSIPTELADGIWIQTANAESGNPGTLPVSSNLALNQPAVASSVENGTFGAANAVDGNAATRWASAEGVDPQWIYVDLGANYQIDHVVLKWEAAYAQAYQIEVSSDASTWTPVFNTTTGNGATDDITFTAVSARYVRMYGTQRATIYGYSLWEFEVYEAGSTEPAYIDFTVDRPVTVYVAYDADAGVTPPTWLTSGFVVNAGLTVQTTDPATQSLKVYSRSFPAGPVSLGGNMGSGASGADSNYLVVVVPVP
ncbi:MAG: FG-GAP-like repeat-containing protein [Thiogranum sp.]